MNYKELLLFSRNLQERHHQSHVRAEKRIWIILFLHSLFCILSLPFVWSNLMFLVIAISIIWLYSILLLILIIYSIHQSCLALQMVSTFTRIEGELMDEKAFQPENYPLYSPKFPRAVLPKFVLDKAYAMEPEPHIRNYPLNIPVVLIFLVNLAIAHLPLLIAKIIEAQS